MSTAIQIPAEYRAAYQRLSESPSPAWLKSLRKAAFDRFQNLGFPHHDEEGWRYTNVAPIRETPYVPAPDAKAPVSRSDLAPHIIPNLTAHTVVLANGAYAPELSTLQNLPKTVRVQSIAMALDKSPDVLEPLLAQYTSFENHAFAALNTALFRDGIFIDVPRGTQVPIPIHVIHLGAPGKEPLAQFPRVLLRASSLSQVSIIETFAGPAKGRYFTCAVTEVAAEDGAVVHHYKIQREGPTAHHVHALHFEQEAQSTVSDHNIAFGGKLARTDLTQRFGGEGGDVTLNGLYVLEAEQHVDNHTTIDHAQRRSTSREFYKGILDGKSRGVFYGKIFVRKDAQKTNASQTNKNLLLSDAALVDSIPALEINADDVKCAHASTIGQLDKDSVFYLRSRGIDEPTARSLLTYAFAREIVAQLPLEPLRAHIEELVLARLPNSRAVKEALHDN